MLTKRKNAKIKDNGAATYASTTTKINEEDIKTAVESSASESGFDPLFLADVLLKFGMLLTGMPLYFYQRAIAWRIFLAVLRFEGEVITVLLARQSGKSETMAVIIDTLTVLMPVLAKIYPELEQFKNGYTIGLFAPQSDQVWTSYNRAMLRLGTENATLILRDPDIDTSLTSEVRLSLTNGSKLTGQIASKQSKIESATYDMVIAEEAQDIEDFIMEKSIGPMVSATGGLIIKVGTTGTHKNHFWSDIKYNRNKDRKLVDERQRLHWEFDYRKIIKYRREQYEQDKKPYHLNYENKIKKEVERYGDQTEAFKLSYALIWSLETGMLMTEKDWDRMVNRKIGLENYDENDILVAGWDIAKKINSSVFTVIKIIEPEDEFTPCKKMVVAWYELVGMDYEAQHHVILDLLIKYNIKRLAGDYTGVGVAVLDRLMYSCGDLVDIIPYTFSRQGKSEMWYALTNDIAAKRIIVPANKTVRGMIEYHNFEEQMMNCQKYFDGPYMVCEKSEGFFDDYVDSLALGCMAADKQGEPVYEVEEDAFNPFYDDLMAARKKAENSY